MKKTNPIYFVCTSKIVDKYGWWPLIRRLHARWGKMIWHKLVTLHQEKNILFCFKNTDGSATIDVFTSCLRVIFDWWLLLCLGWPNFYSDLIPSVISIISEGGLSWTCARTFQGEIVLDSEFPAIFHNRLSNDIISQFARYTYTKYLKWNLLLFFLYFII